MRMTEEATSPLYDLWSKFYDQTFGRLVHKRQIRAIEQVRANPGETILDIGVGTGMTIEHYPRDITIVGMDLSGGMLAKAARKVRKEGFDHCRLIQGDAMDPPFAEHSFDHVILTHVVTVVSDPVKLMNWAQRLVKPGGRIVILNHFLSTNPLIAWFESTLNPIFVKIGWRSDLSLEECLEGCKLDVQYNFKMARFDLWQIVVLGDSKSPPPAKPQAAPAREAHGDSAAGKSHVALVMD